MVTKIGKKTKNGMVVFVVKGGLFGVCLGGWLCWFVALLMGMGYLCCCYFCL